MGANEVIQQEQEYIPADSQLERVRRIRRFNYLAVYLPVGLISLIGLLTVILLIYLAVFQPREETLHTISGYSDALTILAMIPLLLLCAIVPTLLIIGSLQARKNGTAPIRRLQEFMWRFESRIQRVDQPIRRFESRITTPLIAYQAMIAYLGTLIRRLRGFFRQG